MNEDIKINREDLERMAMENVDPEEFYELGDDIEIVSEDDLRDISGLNNNIALTGEENDDKKHKIPEELDRRFRINEQGSKTIYAYANDPERIAFTDKGEKLVATDKSPNLIKDMIAVAESKGWESISVKGEKEFRRKAWLEASAKGLSVRGYEPSEQDLRLLDAEIAKHGNSIEAAEKEKDADADNLSIPAMSQEGKELRAKELKTAMATMNQEDAIEKYPELKEVYEIPPAAVAFYRQQGGLAAEQESSFVSKATDRAIDDLADGWDVPKFDMNTYKTMDIDPAHPSKDRDFDFE